MRVGIVGCGDAAVTVGLASRFVRRCKIVAVADSNEDRRQRFARRFHADACSTLDALLDQSRVDALYLAVPHHLHRELTLRALGAGVAVLLEKPLAHTLADAETLAAAAANAVAEERGVARVAVNYQYRYEPLLHALREAVAAGRLGEIRYAQIEVPWFRDRGYFNDAPWHARLDLAGGGTLLTQGSHLLDLMLSALGPPARATGRTYRRVARDAEVEDLAMGIVETASGVPVAITSSMVSRAGGRARCSVYGSRGSLHYRGPSRPTLKARGIRLARPPVLTELHAYVAALAGFRDWVEDGTPPRCTAADALPVMRAVAALYESARSGRTVAVQRPGSTGPYPGTRRG